MPLVQVKLDKSVNQSRGIFDKYVYEPNNGDSSSSVVETDYWIDSRFIDDPEWDGSVIEMKLSDGYFVGIISGGTILPSMIWGIGVSAEDQDKLDSLPKAYIGIKSDKNYPISQDINNPTIFDDLELDGDAAEGWMVEPLLGAVRNISGRELKVNFGVVSAHTVSTNNSNALFQVYSVLSTDDTGTTWALNQDSARQETVSGQTESYGSKASQAFVVPDQFLVRFEAISDSTNISVSPVSFTSRFGVTTGPSFRWWLEEA